MTRSTWIFSLSVLGLLAVVGVCSWAQEGSKNPNQPVEQRTSPVDPLFEKPDSDLEPTPFAAETTIPRPKSKPVVAETTYRQSVTTDYYIRQPDGTMKKVNVNLPSNPTGMPGSTVHPGSVYPGSVADFPSDASPSAIFGEPMRVKVVPRTVYESQMVPMSKEEQDEINTCQAATATLRSDKPEAEKETARKLMADLLEKQFDRDLATREKDVVELETRVKKLRDQFDKRKAAKTKIIELRLTTIQNEIDGLGFPGMGLGEGSTLPQPGPGFGPVQFFNGGGQLTPAPASNLDSFSHPLEPEVERPVPAEQAPSPSPGR